MIASIKGHEQVIEFLLECGADLNRQCRHGRTALSYLAEYGRDNIILMLLKKAPNIDLPDLGAQIPLLRAALKEHISTVCLLLENDADVHLRDRDGLTPLCHASQNQHTSLALLLLEKSASRKSAPIPCYVQ
ncbi:Similar to Ankyrin repeat domain-containing protein 50; acc. no. Q9ULJ7 [Pyronema omphalodes CBS 100304]|uniref:Similar to Ankyrin repeat domain-containing protein 50 acc. no. Q9ULJ7 n=1 Tax=Pyronema omphalodes (strain CBS 100304) TaxID=1076935 RepID=U4LQQ2_PYROM|nr:Similar to Ankyrin repeat domain-containing protein 50; acc. no. Q9ULJ7 [Pyronema omphalodes CBS 100304]